MSTGISDHLIQLIQSLSKAEKRSFKLYATRNITSVSEMKFVQLFDFIEKTADYSDKAALKKLITIKKTQLSNIKAHLYKQVLTSLRLQHANHIPTITIRESIDHAFILYHKGFYKQALKALEKSKQLASKFHSSMLQLEIVEFEKLIESQYITRSRSTRADELTSESKSVEKHIYQSVAFSNLSLQLYALYVKGGFVRDEKDYHYVKDFFKSNLPVYRTQDLGFIEKMHLYNAYMWYYYIIQEFLLCFKYAKYWVDLFEEYPNVKYQYSEMYLKGLNHYQNAVFNLRNYNRLHETITKIERWSTASLENENVNLLQQLYTLTGKINEYYLTGEFTEGLQIVSKVESYISNNSDRLDNHRIMILYYKVACLYFGAGENKKAIQYLNKIIQLKDVSLREDIQCFARILNLIAHFELNNADLLDYQIKSVYRFLRNMGDLQGVQKEILAFLRQLPFENDRLVINGFNELHVKLVKLAQLPFEKRPFLYLDIISWLESRIQKRTVQAVIKEKYILEQTTGQSIYFP
jgi:tetratricopeptide (TPR) repeat protein